MRRYPKRCLSAGAVAALLMVLLSALGVATALAAKPPPGPPLKVTIQPATAVAGSTNNAFTIKVTAASAAAGQFKVVFPAGWSAPQSSSSVQPGYVAILKQTCTSAGPFPASITGSGPWEAIVNFNCGSNKNFSITYGGSVASSKVAAPSTATSYEFTTSAAIPTGTTFLRLATQPVVTTTAAPVHFEITGLPATVAAGTANAFTVTARDSSNNIVPSYAGAIQFSSTDGAATLPANYAFTAADAGSHIFSPGATFRTLGSRTITATDISNATITGSKTTAVGPGAATHLVVSGLANPSSAGTAQSVTVTAKDQFGNTATGYVGRIRFSSTDGAAVLPSEYTFTAADGGAHTFTGAVTLKTLGSQSVTATDTVTASITGSLGVAVQPGQAASLEVTGLADPSAPGAAQDVTVTALDSVGNVATGYAGTVQFASGDGLSSLPDDYSFTGGDAGSHTFVGEVTLRTAGPQDVTATDSGVTGQQLVTVDDTLYVATSGSDANVGSPAAPLKTINAAVATTASLSGVADIHVAEGAYDEGAGGVAVIDGLSISGGHASDWTQTGTATTIVGSGQSVLADGDTGVSLDHVTLAPTTPLAVGASVYGFRAINGSAAALTNVVITTPDGFPGANGQSGTQGASGDGGAPGVAGFNGVDGNTCPITQGLGGAGGVEFSGGGTGGRGGCGSGSGQSGGSTGVVYGIGGFGGSGDDDQGRPGGDGFIGFHGAFGNPGRGAFEAVPSGPAFVGRDGFIGDDGQAGQGGGGGGGGGGQHNCPNFCYDFSDLGGGGGGGGGGGEGGGGASGGKGAGGSFGVYLYSSTVSVTDSTFTIGRGGPGGHGGLGGTPGSGGGGAAGGSPGGPGSNAGSGGRGGDGGDGGYGGPGGGGSGGPSIGIARADSFSSTVTQSGNTFTLGGGGSGGLSFQSGTNATGAAGVSMNLFP